MSSSSVILVNFIASAKLRLRAGIVVADRSVNMSCSLSICRRISAMRRSLSSCWRLRSSSLSWSWRMRSSLSLLVSANALLRDVLLAAFPVLDHDAYHLREAGDLRQGVTRSPLTLGGCALGVSARFLHWLVRSSGSGCHTQDRT